MCYSAESSGGTFLFVLCAAAFLAFGKGQPAIALLLIVLASMQFDALLYASELRRLLGDSGRLGPPADAARVGPVAIQCRLRFPTSVSRTLLFRLLGDCCRRRLHCVESSNVVRCAERQRALGLGPRRLFLSHGSGLLQSIDLLLTALLEAVVSWRASVCRLFSVLSPLPQPVSEGMAVAVVPRNQRGGGDCVGGLTHREAAGGGRRTSI